MTSQINHVAFKFDEKLVRVWTDATGGLWFVSADVCRVLGIERVNDGLQKDEMCKHIISVPSGLRALHCVSYIGVHKQGVTLGKPEFNKWIAETIVPFMAKIGGK